MRIITDMDIDPNGLAVWAVKDEWYGREQTIHTGSLFGCIEYRRRMEDAEMGIVDAYPNRSTV